MLYIIILLKFVVKGLNNKKEYVGNWNIYVILVGIRRYIFVFFNNI